MAIQLTINGKHSEGSEGVRIVQKRLEENDSFFELDGIIAEVIKQVYLITGIPSTGKFTLEATDEDEWTLNVEA